MSRKKWNSHFYDVATRAFNKVTDEDEFVEVCQQSQYIDLVHRAIHNITNISRLEKLISENRFYTDTPALIDSFRKNIETRIIEIRKKDEEEKWAEAKKIRTEQQQEIKRQIEASDFKGRLAYYQEYKEQDDSNIYNYVVKLIVSQCNEQILHEIIEYKHTFGYNTEVALKHCKDQDFLKEYILNTGHATHLHVAAISSIKNQEFLKECASKHYMYGPNDISIAAIGQITDKEYLTQELKNFELKNWTLTAQEAGVKIALIQRLKSI